MAEKTMRQDYPVEDNEFRRGISATRYIGLLYRRTRKRGIAQNLNRRDKQLARFIITEGRVTAVLQPVFLRTLLAEFGQAGRNGQRSEEQIGELKSAGRQLTSELSGHRQLAEDIAESKRIAIRRLRSMGDKGGFVYRCRKCSRYFTSSRSAERGQNCKWCGSKNIYRARLQGTKRG